MLIVLDKQMQPNGRRITLIPPTQVIGRDRKKCDIVLSDADGYTLDTGESTGQNSVETVSRRHAQISYSKVNGIWTITDLGSRNGTTVNSMNTRKNEVHIMSGDTIGLGGVKLYFTLQNQGKSTMEADATEAIQT